MHADMPKNAPLNGWTRFLFIVGMILAAIGVTIAFRLLPHPMNFTPAGAVALFAGAAFTTRRASLLVPFAFMLVSDYFLGFHSLMPAVYVCLLFNVALGWRLRSRRQPLRIAGASLLGSVVFFVVTNFAHWMLYHPRTLQELGACYVLAIPFFRNNLSADLLFTGALFGMLALAEVRYPDLCRAPQPAAQ